VALHIALLTVIATAISVRMHSQGGNGAK